MKKKTKQDFQELLKTEHCKISLLHAVCLLHLDLAQLRPLLINVNIYISCFLPALLEGFEIRECISFIEEHINRQVGLPKESLIYEQVQ